MIKPLGQNKYRFIVSVGGRNDRKRYTKTITHNGGKRALQTLYEEFEDECKKKPRTDITVEGLLKAYIEHSKVMGRKATTIHGYEVCAERCYPLVGEILAKELTTARLEESIAQMVNNGLSAKTIRNTIGLLSAAYRYAIKIDLLKENPCEKTTVPQGQPRDVRILYIDEIQPFLNAIADRPLDDKVAYELALFLGLRSSEILGLKETDVDLVRGLISIHNTRHRVKGEDIDQTTKTKRSTRVLALPDILIMDIARLLALHRQLPYKRVEYLIQDGFGNIVNPHSLGSRLVRLEAEKGLPHVTMHGLRHTYASLLHSQGVDMANISAELGHSNLTVTMNVYTHIFKSATHASRGIANTINQFTLNGGASVAQLDNEKPSER